MSTEKFILRCSHHVDEANDENNRESGNDENNRESENNENRRESETENDENSRESVNDENNRESENDENSRESENDENNRESEIDQNSRESENDENNIESENDVNDRESENDQNSRKSENYKNNKELDYDENKKDIDYHENIRESENDEDYRESYNDENNRELDYVYNNWESDNDPNDKTVSLQEQGEDDENLTIEVITDYDFKNDCGSVGNYKSENETKTSFSKLTEPSAEVTNDRQGARTPKKKRKTKRISSTIQRMKCDQCGKYIIGKNNLTSHIKKIHLNIRNHACKVCSKAFWSKHALDAHILAVHTRQCGSCQDYVVESVPWDEGVTMRNKRYATCVCGSSVCIISSLGRRNTNKQFNNVKIEPNTDEDINEDCENNLSKLTEQTAEDSENRQSISSPKLKLKTKSRPIVKMRLKCDQCGKYIIGKNNLTSHIKKIHLNIRNHACKVCSKAFWSKHALDAHILAVHTRQCGSCQEYVVESVPWDEGVTMRNKRDVTCACGSSVCIISTIGQGRKNRQLDNVNNDFDTDNDIDEDCETTLSKLTEQTAEDGKNSQAVRALKLKRKTKRRPIHTMKMECEYCGKYITGKNNLTSHIKKIHLNIRNHACKVCGKAFWSKYGLDGHMLAVHTRQCGSCQEYVVESVPWDEGVTMRNKRDVTCACGSSVCISTSIGLKGSNRQVNQLDKDLNIQVLDSKFACGTCGKLFRERKCCELHSRSHNSKTFCLCDICGRSFKYKPSLKKHRLIEHGQVDSLCKKCGESFNNRMDLKNHMSSAHYEVGKRRKKKPKRKSLRVGHHNDEVQKMEVYNETTGGQSRLGTADTGQIENLAELQTSEVLDKEHMAHMEDVNREDAVFVLEDGEVIKVIQDQLN